MANDTIEKSVPMAGGREELMQLFKIPCLQHHGLATKSSLLKLQLLKPKNTAPAKQMQWILSETFKNSHKQNSIQC
jgi:hypothetical protein